jgi:hypothetical protein
MSCPSPAALRVASASAAGDTPDVSELILEGGEAEEELERLASHGSAC